MKKSTGWILFGLAAGVACGVGYYAYKNKDKFIKEEIEVTPDGEIVTKRTYVGLDMDDVKTKAGDAVAATKKTAKKAVQMVNDKIDGLKNPGFELDDEDEEIIYEDFTSVVDEAEAAPEADFVTFDIKADAKASEKKEEVKEEEAPVEAEAAEETTEEAPKKESKSKSKKN